jgi:hypothetical protein
MRTLRLGLLLAVSLTPSAGAQDAPPARVAVVAPAARAQGVQQATVRAVEALHAQALRLDAREGLGDLWGWLWRYGVVILVGAVGADQARRELLRRRDAVRSRAEVFHERLTTYRTLRARLSPNPRAAGRIVGRRARRPS